MTYEDLKKANETIKTTDIKGKEYAEVNQRIKAFRMVFPEGFIIPKMISNENGVCVFETQVGYYAPRNTIAEDKNMNKYQDTYMEKVVLGVGTAYEKENSTFINKTSYIENCETSSVGRALGMCGFGIDTSVASAEEVGNAIVQQEGDKKIDDIKAQALRELIKNKNVSNEYVLELLKSKNYGKLSEIKVKDYMSLVESISNYKGE